MSEKAMVELNPGDLRRLEDKVDKLAEAIQRLILIEERQSSQGERIGSVGRGQFRELGESLHHLGHGHLLRATEADDGKLHPSRGDFINRQSGGRHGGQRCSASFAHDEGGPEIPGVEQAFHRAQIDGVLSQHTAQRFGNGPEAARPRPLGRAGDGAVRDDGWVRCSGPQHTPARAAERRIHAQHDLDDRQFADGILGGSAGACRVTGPA